MPKSSPPAAISLLDELLGSLPQRGRVHWIGLRPKRGVAPVSVEMAEAAVGTGLTGDRFTGTAESKRQVTLIQLEHLGVIAALLSRAELDPGLLRRNIVVTGINLLALNGAEFRIGNALLQGTGGCHPCSKMEATLGAGGFNAMRGHGGITARVLEPGSIRVGDEVALVRAGRLPAHER
jgi:MOSC domain-containing protein YiiM